MTREEVRNEILSLDSSNILCELPTSFGKTKVALELLKKRFPNVKTSNPKILIVIPRLVLIDNWKDEFKKWKFEKYLPYVEFVTYVSFPKKDGEWDMVIFDEVHHLSPRCREFLELGYFSIKYSIMLSATVGRDMKKELNERIVEIDSEIEKYNSFITDMNAASLSTEAKKTLISEQINNPVYDCEKARDLLMDEMTAWQAWDDRKRPHLKDARYSESAGRGGFLVVYCSRNASLENHRKNPSGSSCGALRD